MRRLQFSITCKTDEVRHWLPEIQALADSEKSALGFLPAGILEDAVLRRRVIVAFVDRDGDKEFAGYLLSSGIFPNAKVQHIAAAREFRQMGAASALMRWFVSDLERQGHMAIRADVASDLVSARAFYEKHGFEFFQERPGGAARSRIIRIYSKTLESDNLFSRVERETTRGTLTRVASSPAVPVFAFDLNVYLDLLRKRARSDDARRLFAEADGSLFRLVIADEFVAELRRNSRDAGNDPLLAAALQLPRLPKPEEESLSKLANEIHTEVFVKQRCQEAGTPQALSDARHIAHAALSNATAFITSDGALLDARTLLLNKFGIDVANIQEVLLLLPPDELASDATSRRGIGYAPVQLNKEQFAEYCTQNGLLPNVANEFCIGADTNSLALRIGIQVKGMLAGVGALYAHKTLELTSSMLVHVRHEIAGAALFADYLLSTLLESASKKGPTSVSLVHLPGQSAVHQLALGHGFHRTGAETHFNKISIGAPLSSSNWSKLVPMLRRRTGLRLPAAHSEISPEAMPVTLPNGEKTSIMIEELERLLGPTLILWPDRSGVMVPIQSQYATELFGTSEQPTFDFIEHKDAGFLSHRAFVNTPRAAGIMRPGEPIVFYESAKGKGRGAAIAIARIVSAVIMPKNQVDPASDQRIVIEDTQTFSSSPDVLMTTFDNVMKFQRPVPFALLKKMQTVSGANMVTAQRLSGVQLSSIITQAWKT